MRRFYAPTSVFTADKVVLGPDESRHLSEVLRLRADEDVYVFDGEGGEFECRIDTLTKKGAILTVIKEIGPRCPESPLELTLAAALTKGEKFDLVIQKAVELGVTRLVPLVTERCDVKLKDPEKRIERWNRIVVESSKQCGRATLMGIESAISFNDFLKSDGLDIRVLFTERGGANLSSIKSSQKITALIGPEGGWSDSELESADAVGVLLVTLGGRILRAETAAISIATILQNCFGDLR